MRRGIRSRELGITQGPRMYSGCCLALKCCLESVNSKQQGAHWKCVDYYFDCLFVVFIYVFVFVLSLSLSLSPSFSASASVFLLWL